MYHDLVYEATEQHNRIAENFDAIEQMEAEPGYTQISWDSVIQDLAGNRVHLDQEGETDIAEFLDSKIRDKGTVTHPICFQTNSYRRDKGYVFAWSNSNGSDEKRHNLDEDDIGTAHVAPIKDKEEYIVVCNEIE